MPSFICLFSSLYCFYLCFLDRVASRSTHLGFKLCVLWGNLCLSSFIFKMHPVFLITYEASVRFLRSFRESERGLRVLFVSHPTRRPRNVQAISNRILHQTPKAYYSIIFYGKSKIRSLILSYVMHSDRLNSYLCIYGMGNLNVQKRNKCS